MIAILKIIFGMLCVLVLLGVCPFVIGVLLSKKASHDLSYNFIYVYMLGLMLLVAISEVIGVPLTLMKASFSTYVLIYSGVLILLMLLAVLTARQRMAQILKKTIQSVKNADRRWRWILLGVFLPILLVEFRTTYVYGDDKVYLAMVNDIVTSNRLYLTNIETGGTDGWVIAKYALSSYWLWIAYLVKISKVHVLILCKTILPFVFVPLGYALQGLLASYLFKGEQRKIWIFMFLVLIFTFFGGFSTYPVTYRFYTWVWQSKAFLAIIAVPFMFLYCSYIYEKGPAFRDYVFLAIMNIAMSSTTLTGTGLAVAMSCVLSMLYAVLYKRLRIVFYTILTCIPSFFIMVFYLKYAAILEKINFYG